eukprot:927836_1
MDPYIVLKNICNNLQSLSIDSMRDDKHDMEGLTFNNLVELCLLTPSSENMLSIIEKTKCLKRLRVEYLRNESDTAETESSHALAFGKIFELDTLQYFYFEFDGEDAEISQLVRWIESSFLTKRDIFKLEIASFDYHPVGEIHNAMRTIWNVLSTWCTSHCMLIWSFQTQESNDIYDECQQSHFIMDNLGVMSVQQLVDPVYEEPYVMRI